MTPPSPNWSGCCAPVARWRSAWLPERICWLLSDEYHANEGGHVRIYKATDLRDKIASRGLRFTHSHHAHGLHSPFWWLKCAVGVEQNTHPAVTAYHKLLVWDMMARPLLTRATEAALDPLIGKSVALYFEKPAVIEAVSEQALA